MAKMKIGYQNKNRPDLSRPITPTAHVTSVEGSFYLQEGKVFDIKGNEVENPPEWIDGHIQAMDQAAREQFGFPTGKTTKKKSAVISSISKE